MNEFIQSGQLLTSLLVAGGIIIAILLLMAFLRSFLIICRPDEALVVSGRSQRLPDGTIRGYSPRVGGGYVVRKPIIETVSKMSIAAFEVPISVKGAYSKGGIPLNVDAISVVKISSDPLVIGNAIERFLGRDPMDIRRVAKETLEGHLRGVLAQLTPEEVNEDRLKFADGLALESEEDLQKLGLHLDTLKIVHVQDDVKYLESIGRVAIANVLRAAQIAESDAQRAAEQAEAENLGRANVTKANVESKILQMRNDLRKIQADLEAEVRSEEERTTAAAREARATTEQELQQVRTELESIRLQCDAVLPAEAGRVASEFRARGEAAIIRERGQAVAQALTTMQAAWKDAGKSALQIALIEDIEKILVSASAGVSKVKIDGLHLIDGGDGKTLCNYVAAYPAMLGSVFDAVEKTTGINIPETIAGKEVNS